MRNKIITIGSLASLGLLFSTASSAAISHTASAMTQPASQFRRIEQPLATKAIVTIAGISVIGLELWWFLGSKPQAKPEQQDK